MTASPEFWNFIYRWLSLYSIGMILTGIWTYNGTLGFGWILASFSTLGEQIQGFSALL